MIYDPVTDQYTDPATGETIDRDETLALLDQALEAGGERVRGLAGEVANGEIGPEAWHERMREEILLLMLIALLLGRGGRGSADEEDYATVGRLTAAQYRWLKDFAGDVGNLSEAEIARRAAMYINSSREAYERGHGRAALAGGYTEERWVTDPAKEHCGDCIALASRGWVEIGSIPNSPGDGGTECRQNCGCHKEYR